MKNFLFGVAIGAAGMGLYSGYLKIVVTEFADLNTSATDTSKTEDQQPGGFDPSVDISTGVDRP